MKKVTLLTFSLLLGCTSGNCRTQRTEKMDEKAINAASAQATSSPSAKVKVFKYDGSQQCGMGKAIPVAEMQKELSGITVHSAENKPDGLMHIQACGTPTGRANVYEIDKTSLEAALKKGFKQWTFE
jgi:hypothetical protein